MPPEQEDGSTESSALKYITAEEVGNIVNSAVTNHLKRHLGSAIEAAIKPLAEKLSAPPPAPPADVEDKKSKKNQDPEFLALQKQIESLTKGIAEEKERSAAAEKKARDERAFGDLRASLEGKVRPELLDMLAKHLFFVDKQVDFGDDGSALFKSTRSLYPGAEPEEYRLPLKAGVEEFLKSEAAKPFLPAPSTSGAAPLPKRPGQVQNPGNTDFSKPATSDDEKIRRSLERERMAQEKLRSKT